MRGWMIVPTLILALTAVSAGPVAGTAADPASGSGSPGAFLEALAMVPDAPQARRSMLSYLDMGAVAAARPGAAQPGSVAELQALLTADDPAAERWRAALMGARSGDMELLQRLGAAGSWPDVLGFDPFDVERHLTFGEPPSDGSVLLGDVDPDAIASAFAAQGYSSSPKGAWTLLCGAAGCDKGLTPDLANVDRSLPFGRRDRTQRAAGGVPARHPQLCGPGHDRGHAGDRSRRDAFAAGRPGLPRGGRRRGARCAPRAGHATARQHGLGGSLPRVAGPIAC